MHITSTLAVTVALPAIIAAHGSVPGAPKLFGLGRRDIHQLKTRNAFKSHLRVLESSEPNIEKRATSGNIDGQCGSGFGSCAAGYCCSGAGWCGLKGNSEYCAAPDCQFNYGSGCDTLQVPSGPVTSGVARTKLGSVAYGGAGIYECTVPGTVAITYDDGPYIYTDHVLDLLDQYKAKATFFISGNNNGKGMINDASTAWPTVIKRAYTAGHQIASHTWGHQDLSAITQAQRKNQMYYNEIAFNDILGVFPTYMRPPYSSCTGQCETDLAALGYHVVYFNLDTEDYLHDDPNEIQTSKNDFLGNLSAVAPAAGAALSISHDIHQQTAYNLTEYMLQTLQTKGFKAVTVGECLGDPQANWYRALGGGGLQSGSPSASASASASRTSSAPISTSTKLTIDATCGGANGYTCAGSAFGNCCSVNGWCGATNDYCGTGCQSAFGTCGTTSASASAPAVSIVTRSIPPSSTTAASAALPSSSSTTPGNKIISPDATCGSTTGYTCQGSAFGNCCSVSGYCGATDAYCGAGCQSGFGSCGSGSGVSVSAVQPSTTKASSLSTSVRASSTSSSVSRTTTAATTPTATPKPSQTCFTFFGVKYCF